MEAPARRPRRRTGAKLLHWLRVTGLLVLLLLITAGLYLNQVGLPDFLRRPLLQQLRARGVDLQVTRLRLSWHRGIVAENARFGRAVEPAGPIFAAAEVELHLDVAAITRFRLSPGALVIHRGKLVWPLQVTNQSAKTFSVEEVDADLRFLPDDQWELSRFDARFARAKLHVSGTLAHASAIRDLKLFTPGHPAPAGRLEAKLSSLVETLEHIRFEKPPDLKLDVHGDAQDLNSFTGLLTASVPGAETPWGTLTHAELTARSSAPPAPRGLPSVTLNLLADAAQTRQARVEDLQLTAHFTFGQDQSDAVKADLDLQAGTTATELGDANAVHIRAQLRRVEAGTPAQADQNWGWWAKFEPCSLDGRIEIIGVKSPKLQAEEIVCDARWYAPNLVLTNLRARLYGGKLDAGLGLNVATREASFRCSSDFDVQRLAPLLTEAARHWLLQFAWRNPPSLTGRGFAILPAWTNREPDWRAEVQPTLRLEGELQTGPASYRGVQVSSAYTHFYYSNLCWHLPDLHVTRPEGRADLVHISSDRTRDMYWRVKGDIDLRALKPVMDEKARRDLDRFAFTQPPHVEGEIWGSRHEKTPRGFVGQVTLSNFTFRGESATSFHSALHFTNQVLALLNPRVMRDAEVATAEKVLVDFATQQVFLTNGLSTTDPMAIARAIGPKTAKTVAHYQFLQAPEGHVTGVVPFHGTEGADMLFELDGGPFRWWRFNLPHIRGTVHWAGTQVTLKVADADFYTGKIHGGAFFDSRAPQGADFRFDAVFTNANLQLLMSDVSARTNRLEGLLTGRLRVDNANSEDWESWQGRGDIHLRDGYVWELPLFSVFSPLLDGIVPGLGSTRFSDGSATFSITNSVINYGDLELRAPMLRMKFRGNVDFHGKVDAKVEADLLRDTWIIGPLVSTALWPLAKILEYKVTGTLTEPKAEPLYVPKLLLLPLQPLRMLKGLFPADSSVTNAPLDINW